MKKVYYILVLVALAVLTVIPFIGCGSVTTEYKEVRIRDTVITVQPQIIERTLAPSIDTDSLVAAFEIRGRDTITDVRYAVKEKRIYLKVKPDSVKLTVHDTLWKNSVTTIGDSWWSHTETWVLAGLAALALLFTFRKKLGFGI